MMVDSTLAASLSSQPSGMDRLDAAQALLDVVGPHGGSETNQTLQQEPRDDVPVVPDSHTVVTDDTPVTRPRSGSIGLDELAALAASMDTGESGAAVSASSSDEDSVAMPPPPPRRRPRSASNPEGMEKWDPLKEGNRKHFVLPSAILEEELAEASALAEARAHEKEMCVSSLPLKKRSKLSLNAFYGTSPNSVTSPIMSATKDDSAEEEDLSLEEDDVEPEEMLRRARSRLLEDLSEGSLKGEKGVLTLPHALSKYKEVYNKNGRIGIYTPKERAAIIARFHSKRSRRVWNKKIRYGCRKNLADRRLRVKGRFVKRTPETVAATLPTTSDVSTPPTLSSVSEEHTPPDLDMPDVNDPEAGFCPTPGQPYRRMRRHTIT